MFVKRLFNCIIIVLRQYLTIFYVGFSKIKLAPLPPQKNPKQKTLVIVLLITQIKVFCEKRFLIVIEFTERDYNIQ